MPRLKMALGLSTLLAAAVMLVLLGTLDTVQAKKTEGFAGGLRDLTADLWDKAKNYKEYSEYYRNKKKTRNMEVAEIAKFLEAYPPCPLQVFENGPTSRKDLERKKKRFKDYKYQWVCVLNQKGIGTWHRRSYPRFWRSPKPPFQMRIVRPDFPGMLYQLLDRKDVQVNMEEREVKDLDTGVVEKEVRFKIEPAGTNQRRKKDKRRKVLGVPVPGLRREAEKKAPKKVKPKTEKQLAAERKKKWLEKFKEDNKYGWVERHERLFEAGPDVSLERWGNKDKEKGRGKGKRMSLRKRAELEDIGAMMQHELDAIHAEDQLLEALNVKKDPGLELVRTRNDAKMMMLVMKEWHMTEGSKAMQQDIDAGIEIVEGSLLGGPPPSPPRTWDR